MRTRYFTRLTDGELAALMTESRVFSEDGNAAARTRFSEAAAEAARRLQEADEAERQRRAAIMRRGYAVLWWVFLLGWPLALLVMRDAVQASYFGRGSGGGGMHAAPGATWLGVMAWPLLIAGRWAVTGAWRFVPGGWPAALLDHRQ
jgi:hypothetical protein